MGLWFLSGSLSVFPSSEFPTPERLASMRERGTERLVCEGTKIQGSRKRWSSQRLSLKYGE